MAKVVAFALTPTQRIKIVKQLDNDGNEYFRVQNEFLTDGKWETWPVVTSVNLPTSKLESMLKALALAADLELSVPPAEPEVKQEEAKPEPAPQQNAESFKRYIITVTDTDEQVLAAIRENRNSPVMDFATRAEALETHSWPRGTALNVVRFHGSEIQKYRTLYEWHNGWVTCS